MDVVLITLEGEFAGWHAELRKTVSARILLDLESGNAGKALAAFSKMVISHNFKGLDGKPCDDVLDAPVDALTQTLEKWGKGNQANPK